MDLTVINKFWTSSWTIRIGMIFTGLAWLDPVSLMAQYPQIWEMLPDAWENTVYRVLLALSGLSMIWKRFQTDSGVTTDKAKVTPPVEAALATGKLTSEEIEKMRKVVEQADKVGKL